MYLSIKKNEINLFILILKKIIILIFINEQKRLKQNYRTKIMIINII